MIRKIVANFPKSRGRRISGCSFQRFRLLISGGRSEARLGHGPGRRESWLSARIYELHGKRGSGPLGSLVLLSINQRRVISRVRQLHSGYFAGLPSSAPFVKRDNYYQEGGREGRCWKNLKVCFENEGFRWIIGSWVVSTFKLVLRRIACIFNERIISCLRIFCQTVFHRLSQIIFNHVDIITTTLIILCSRCFKLIFRSGREILNFSTFFVDRPLLE